jgi:hypothetical protein
MKRRRILTVAAITMALASLACSVELPSLPFGPNIELGEPGQFKIGPEQTDALEIAGTGTQTDLRIQFAAGRLQIAGGGEELLKGTATYNVAELKPVVEGSGSSWTVRTGDVQGFSAVAAAQLVNTWELTLGRDPLDLDFDIGAVKADVDLGDVAVARLDMDVGASDISMAFSTPNPSSMESLTVKAGAAQLDFSRLANAEAKRMDFTLGGGDVTLDFSGQLSQDLEVTINGAAGNFTINVPDGTAASLSTSGGLISVNTDEGWISEGDGYVHEGSGPEIHIGITAGAGNVNLRSD